MNVYFKKKVHFDVNIENQTATVAKNCTIQYAKKVVRDWLKECTNKDTGWFITVDETLKNDEEVYYFTFIYAAPCSHCNHCTEDILVKTYCK